MFLKVSSKVQAAKNIIPLMRSTNFQKNLYKLLGDDENHNSSFMSFVQVVFQCSWSGPQRYQNNIPTIKQKNTQVGRLQ